MTFVPWDVVWVSGSPERIQELAREVSTFVRTRLEQVLRRVGNSPDPWLDEGSTGGASVSDAVHEVCESLGQHATEIAPPFVTRDYEIRVEALPPANWHQYGDRRVRLAVSLRSSGETYDLTVAGSS